MFVLFLDIKNAFNRFFGIPQLAVSRSLICLTIVASAFSLSSARLDVLREEILPAAGTPSQG
eukprot:14931715-Alexandrium_andersonii.AAC.1